MELNRLHASQMVMTKKGWAALNDGKPLTIIRANWDGYTGDVLAVIWGDTYGEEKRSARMLAAAPKMLEALKMAENEYVEAEDFKHPVYLALRAAIAAAEGQS